MISKNLMPIKIFFTYFQELLIKDGFCNLVRYILSLLLLVISIVLFMIAFVRDEDTLGLFLGNLFKLK